MEKVILNYYRLNREKKGDPTPEELLAAGVAAAHPEHILRLAAVMRADYNRATRPFAPETK